MKPEPSLQILVAFAVKEETHWFKPPPGVKVFFTGIGKANARHALKAQLRARRPRILLSCGFAGGLNPALHAGDVVFDAGDLPAIQTLLRGRDAKPARFHSAGRVLITSIEKRQAWAATHADAVDMESETVREIARRYAIPAATIRAVSDGQQDSLPLDFNQTMTADYTMDYRKLTLAILASPALVPKLIRFHRGIRNAARRLGTVLNEVVASLRTP